MPKSREAAAKLEEGLSLYRAEDYAAAARIFEEGYTIEADPTFLYTWAQAERLAGQCAEAVQLYTQFIDTSPPEIQVQAAQDGKARCADQLAQQQDERDTDEDDEDDLDALADTVAPSSVSVSQSSPSETLRSAPTDEAEPPIPWQRDVAGGVLVGLGAAGLGTGIGLLIGGAVLKERGPATYAETQTHEQRVRSLSISGGVVMGVGATLLLVGVIRYGILARRERADLGVVPTFDGRTAGALIVGRF